MSVSRFDFSISDRNPITVAELLAEDRSWNFERHTDDTMELALEGLWKIYSVAIDWSESRDLLTFACSFEMRVASPETAEFLGVLNLANTQTWLGAFAYADNSSSVVYRYRLKPIAGSQLSVGQFDRILATMVADCDRFYPSFNLVKRGRRSAAESIRTTIVETHGTA